VTLVGHDDYMKTLKDSNIKTFIQYVMDYLTILAAVGETSNDLLTNLFNVYCCAKDKQFVAWVNIK